MKPEPSAPRPAVTPRAIAPDRAGAFEKAMRGLSALGPAVLAASGAESVPAAARDEGVVRVVGLGYAGIFRALDVVAAAPAMLLPIGTRALRAGLASALVAGVSGAVAFDLALALTTSVVPLALARVGVRGAGVSPRLLAAVSALAVLAALLAPAWQAESAAPGGAVTGALIVLAALRIGLGAGSTLPAAALVLGLAASYEPLVFVSAGAALAPTIALAVRDKKVTRPLALRAGALFVLGLLPLGLGAALTTRPAELSLGASTSFVAATPWPRTVTAFASSEIGVLLLAAAGAGAVLVALVPAARRALAALGLVAAAGAAAVALRAPAGPVVVAASVLAAIVAVHALASVALGVVVVAIARARVPFAEASAAFVVVLELVLPVRALDETTTRRDARAARAAAVWNEAAWGPAPPGAVVLVSERETMQRIVAARATGEMRGDLLVVPAYDLHGRAAQRALAAEPKLVPLYRDFALGVPPEELALAELARARPLLSRFDPKWERSLARHLVPVGLTSRFEAEPRGASDRKRALDAFAPDKERLVRVAVAKPDRELAAATAALLRARAIAMAAAGEREMLSRTLDDLRAFSPEDPVGATLVRRIVTSKGPIDVRDLSP